MRFLGIDFGAKRIGLAVSDANGLLAFPKEIVLNDKKILEKLEEIIKGENIEEIVIGESIDFSGKANPISVKIESFILSLKKFGLPVHKQKEFLTSVAASSSKENKTKLIKKQSHSRLKLTKKEKNDSEAAALILQRYLDKRKIINKK